MSVACRHGEKRLGDLPSALIVVYDTGHSPILPHRGESSYFEQLINIIRTVDPLLPAASWLMALSAVVSATACLGMWRSVPWQGRQSALVMAAAMITVAAGGGDTMIGLVLGVVLLASAMLGTAGVRGTPAANACCHRALVSLVMAICSFESLSTGERAVEAGGHGRHGLDGVLSVLVVAGVVAVVLWTVVSEWVLAPVHQGRTGRLLAVESWAMATGVAVMCVA
ncbi:hypothetical protein SRABI44_02827 [Microbacterium foliorum]|nr:hypothetical protein SRABI03_02387 [Microbacterium foliorum]CAH0237728.1 hypothetical protein SRABI44_02827 [Microbacterium foliorum]